MLDLVNDAFRRVLPESLDACMNELGSHGDTHAEHGEDNNSENNSREDTKAKKLRDDATQPFTMASGQAEGGSGSRQAEGGSGSRQVESGSGSRQTNGENGSGQSAGGNVSGQSGTANAEPRQKIFVLFDEDGRLVGDKAAEYSSHLGEYSRAHASIAHHRWKNVSDDDKTLIWKRISEEYDLSGTTKEKVMAKANEYWRKYKSSSLRKVYDKYRTDEERKRHCQSLLEKKIGKNLLTMSPLKQQNLAELMENFLGSAIATTEIRKKSQGDALVPIDIYEQVFILSMINNAASLSEDPLSLIPQVEKLLEPLRWYAGSDVLDKLLKLSLEILRLVPAFGLKSQPGLCKIKTTRGSKSFPR
ncbi:hypothetical protein IFM89_007169 [Coptis chinensis]|uniref:Uncharacterized protein n=1 Tax=Coptis chinensis TaxID=261450 RepID=A0A835HA49_9MAGN|nr:hypothetical protein IFM89_007169 [Coptis chinensis]